MYKIKILLDKRFSIMMQYLTLLGLEVWLAVFRKKTQIVNLQRNFVSDGPMVIVSNHMTRLDPTTIYTAFGNRGVFKMVPVKFMTATKYYNSLFKPYLFSIGCYPHKDRKHSGVEGSLYYISQGYNIFMFPEGKMNKSYKLNKVYPGISKILTHTKNPKIILVNIYWEQRKIIFSRPEVRIIIDEANDNLRIDDPYAIMREIYKLPDKHGLK